MPLRINSLLSPGALCDPHVVVFQSLSDFSMAAFRGLLVHVGRAGEDCCASGSRSV